MPVGGDAPAVSEQNSACAPVYCICPPICCAASRARTGSKLAERVMMLENENQRLKQMAKENVMAVASMKAERALFLRLIWP